MKVFAPYPDPEMATVEALEASEHFDAAAGVALPSDWTKAADPYVVVTLDGSVSSFPVARATVRLVAYSASPTEAKRLALRAQAALTAYTNGSEARSFQPLSGPWSSEDEEHHSPVAALTMRCVLRAAIPVVV